jgi:hypothetical protein
MARQIDVPCREAVLFAQVADESLQIGHVVHRGMRRCIRLPDARVNRSVGARAHDRAAVGIDQHRRYALGEIVKPPARQYLPLLGVLPAIVQHDQHGRERVLLRKGPQQIAARQGAARGLRLQRPCLQPGDLRPPVDAVRIPGRDRQRHGAPPRGPAGLHRLGRGGHGSGPGYHTVER